MKKNDVPSGSGEEIVRFTEEEEEEEEEGRNDDTKFREIVGGRIAARQSGGR